MFVKKDLKKLSSEMKVSQICESAGFMRKVSIGQDLRTTYDVDDGFGGTTGSCREYTLHRDHIQILNPLGWSMDTPGSVQFFKSESYVVLINMELRCRCRLRRETDLTPGFSYPEAHIPTWMNRGMTKITLPRTLRLSVLQALGRPHAMTSSIEETHASKPQAQSSLMNYFCKEFIKIDKRKWTDHPAHGIVERISLVENLEKNNKSCTTSGLC